jgi:hypothetical protein
MSSAALAQKVEDLAVTINEEIHVKAPLQVTFDALIEQLTDGMTAAGDKPMPMKIEAWPGGRWWRDLGDGNGHLWAHVQAIKRPTLLEFTGPLMMSLAVAVPVEGRGRRDGDHIPSLRAGVRGGGFPEGFRRRLEDDQPADEGSGGEEGEVAVRIPVGRCGDDVSGVRGECGDDSGWSQCVDGRLERGRDADISAAEKDHPKIGVRLRARSGNGVSRQKWVIARGTDRSVCAAKDKITEASDGYGGGEVGTASGGGCGGVVGRAKGVVEEGKRADASAG